jgi:flagellar basal-body rod protein FlgC
MASDLFGSMAISGAGLTAQRTRMDAIAKNIANSATTRTADGEPYRRRTVVLEGGPPDAPLVPQLEMTLPMQRTAPGHLTPVELPAIAAPAPPAVQATEVVDAASGFDLVFDPGHPDAGPDGYVRMPGIDTVTETIDMVAATRAYEANLAAMKAYQSIVAKSLEI